MHLHTITSRFNSHHPGAYWKSQHQSEAQRAREWEVKVEELLHDIQCVFGKRFCRRETKIAMLCLESKLICLLFIIFDFSDIVSYCCYGMLYGIISCFCRTIFVDFIPCCNLV